MDYFISILKLNTATLTAMWQIPILRVFLAFAVLAVCYGLIRYMIASTKRGM